MKTTAQIIAEHPDWTDRQVLREFDNLMEKDARSIGKKLRKMQEILETDPVSAKDDAFQFWAEIFRDSANLINPPWQGLLSPGEDEPTDWVDLDGARSKNTNKPKKK